MNFAVGVTTVPQRRADLLPRTLASLRAAGFAEPWVFVDGTAKPESLRIVLPRETIRDPKIGALANWLLGLQELWLRNPEADRFLMVQDDVVFVRNLRQYLEERCKLALDIETGRGVPGGQYWNLYNFSTDSKEYSPALKPGFYLPGHQGKGALVLCFDNPGVQKLLQSPAWAEAMLSGTARAYKRIDGTISAAFRVAKGRELVHWPSLCQHIGEESTLGNLPGPTHRAPSFPGENFDAMEWLK